MTSPNNEQELRERILKIVDSAVDSAYFEFAREEYVTSEQATDQILNLIEEATNLARIEAQINFIDYLDQIPSNDVMDWKGLLADCRKLAESDLKTLKGGE